MPRIAPGVGDVQGFGRRVRGIVADSAASRDLASPKSSSLTDTGWRQLDVGRLRIAMHDAAFVRRFERVGNLEGDAKGFRR